MKILIINDTHYGIKNGHEVYLKQAERFFDKVFETCREHQITTIFHLGDFFDNRRQIPVEVISRVKSMFLDRLVEEGIEMHIVLGNHDVTYRNTNRVNSLEAIFEPHYNDRIKIYTHPTYLLHLNEGVRIGLIPWITEENREECLQFMEETKAEILMGHFEIEGFAYIANSSIKSRGLSQSIFKRFDMVLSGHYHVGSQIGNITYLGAPYPMNWGDVDDPKCFHVLDLGEKKLIPILNEDSVYVKIQYSGTKPSGDDWSWIEGKFVRLIVTSRGDDPDEYESFVTTLQSCNPYDLKIFEDYQLTIDNSSSIMEDSDLSIDSTQSLLTTYVDDIQTDSDISKDRLKNYILGLYTEATSDSAS